MSSAPRLATLLVPQTISHAQRWDLICQAVGEACLADAQRAQSQTDAADYLAGEAHDAACDTILQLVMAPEAMPMMNDVREFLHVTYGGQR